MCLLNVQGRDDIETYFASVFYPKVLNRLWIQLSLSVVDISHSANNEQNCKCSVDLLQNWFCFVNSGNLYFQVQLMYRYCRKHLPWWVGWSIQECICT